MDDLVLSNMEYKKLDDNINNLHRDFLSIMSEMDPSKLDQDPHLDNQH